MDCDKRAKQVGRHLPGSIQLSLTSLLFLIFFILQSLGPHKGKITGSTAKKEMVKSRLPNPVLAKIWRLADVDQVTQWFL